MLNLDYIKSLVEKIPRFIRSVNLVDNHFVIVEIEVNFLVPCVLFLKKHVSTKFYLMDITALDYPKDKQRFRVIYQFLSYIYNQRLTLKISSSSTESIPSLVNIFRSANWLEREVWDLFGIFFSNHPDLRRILTDYGFQGFPLRKDFPLSGFVELIYSDEEKRVMYVPLELSQEFRFFDFSSSW